MPMPSNCPTELYTIMEDCWKAVSALLGRLRRGGTWLLVRADLPFLSDRGGTLN